MTSARRRGSATPRHRGARRVRRARARVHKRPAGVAEELRRPPSRGSCPSARRSPRSPARARRQCSRWAARSTNGSCKRVLPGCALPRREDGRAVLATGLWIASTGTTSHLLALDCAGAQCSGRSNGSPWRGASSDGPSTSRADVSSGRPAVAAHPVVLIAANRRGRCEGISRPHLRAHRLRLHARAPAVPAKGLSSHRRYQGISISTLFPSTAF